MKYYMVNGKNRHIPMTFWTPAESKADAVISFFVGTNGTEITSIYRISKKHFKEQTKF